MNILIKPVLCGAVGVLFAAGAAAETVEFVHDAANFPAVPSITNVYFPLTPGTTRAFRGIGVDECEFSKQTIGFVNTDYPAGFTVDGVAVLVVRDQEWVTEAEDGECSTDEDAELQEDTVDFYAEQNMGDGAGVVWYEGEETFSLPDEGEGPECSIEGTWRADGVEQFAGILMLADPEAGQRYQQEFYEEVAEDWAAVLRTNGNVTIEFGGGDTYDDCVVTREWSPLEHGSVEKKHYCEAQDGFDGGLALVEEQKEKTLRVEYIGTDLPGGITFPGDGAAFPAFGVLGLGCTDPGAP